LLRVDAETLAIIDAADVANVSTIPLFDASHVFVAYSRELQETFGFPLFLRRIVEGRRRAANLTPARAIGITATRCHTAAPACVLVPSRMRVRCR
jgi:hypothetical protein